MRTLGPSPRTLVIVQGLIYSKYNLSLNSVHEYPKSATILFYIHSKRVRYWPRNASKVRGKSSLPFWVTVYNQVRNNLTDGFLLIFLTLIMKLKRKKDRYIVHKVRLKFVFAPIAVPDGHNCSIHNCYHFVWKVNWYLYSFSM